MRTSCSRNEDCVGRDHQLLCIQQGKIGAVNQMINCDLQRVRQSAQAFYVSTLQALRRQGYASQRFIAASDAAGLGRYVDRTERPHAQRRFMLAVRHFD